MAHLALLIKLIIRFKDRMMVFNYRNIALTERVEIVILIRVRVDTGTGMARIGNFEDSF